MRALLPRRALAWGLGLGRLHGTDRHGRRECLKPVELVQDAQRLRQRAKRGALSVFEVLDRVECDARPIGQLLLIETLPEPKGPNLTSQLSFPLSRGIHTTLIALNRAIINIIAYNGPKKGY